MFYEWFIAALIAGGIGVAVHFACKRFFPDYELTWKEFGFGMALWCAVVSFGTIKGFEYFAVQNLITYHENWSGFETKANWEKMTCYRDGSCRHCYDCDPYTVKESYDCSYTTGTGNNRRTVSKTCYRDVTKYHSCPYADEEWTFWVDASTGDSVTMGDHWFPTDPQSHRYRTFVSVPTSTPSGIPADWQAAHDRLAAGHPGPVVFRHSYSNYILPADESVLRKFSSNIGEFKQQAVLPKLNNDPSHFYIGDRVYFVGTQPSGDWQAASNYFNAAFGLEKQGDLQLVIVDSNKVSSTQADDYVGALAAYWQGPDFQKDTLSKNGIVVVLGTSDNKTVSWSRGITGMPAGNELLVVDLRDDLQGKSLDPATIFGHPTGAVTADADGKLKVTVTHTGGALESILWGPNGFQRVHMKDYVYLKHEIKPTGDQMVWLYAIIVVLSMFGWGLTAYLGPQTFHRFRR